MIRRGKINSSTNKENPNSSAHSKNKVIFSLNILLTVIAVFLIYAIVTDIPFTRTENQIEKDKLDKIPTVEILNGCGYPGVADRFTDKLRSKNFDVVKIGNFTSFDVDTSFVIDRCGIKKYAIAVAESLGIPTKNVIQHFNKNYFLDVTFVIGKDFNNYLKVK